MIQPNPLSAFEAIRQDAREGYEALAVGPIQDTLQQHLTTTIIENRHVISEQWNAWHDALFMPLRNSGSLRLRLSSVYTNPVLRAPFPNVDVESEGGKAKHFFDVEFAEVQNDVLRDLRRRALTTMYLDAIAEGVNDYEVVWAEDVLPRTFVKDRLYEHPLLGDSPLNYNVNDAEMDDNYGGREWTEALTVRTWAEKAGVRLVKRQKKSGTRRRRATLEDSTTLAELKESSYLDEELTKEEISVSEISVLLRSAWALRTSGTTEHTELTTITKPELLFDENGQPTKSTLREFRPKKSLTKLSHRLAHTIDLKSLIQIAEGSEDIAERIVSVANSRGFDPRLTVHQRLQANTALLDTLLRSDSFKLLTER